MDIRTYSMFRAAGAGAMIAVLAVILYESAQARGGLGVPELTTNEAYVAHFAIYAAVAFCAMVAIGRATVANVAAVFLLAAGLGVAMEIYQAYEPTRTASVEDAFADATGAVFGLTAFVAATMLMEPPPRQPTKL